MNLDAISVIVDMVAAAAVVVSLIYLAIQTRANTKALRANAIWNAEKIFGDVNYSHAANPEFSDLSAKAFNPEAKLEDFSATEINQMHFAVRGCIQYMNAQRAMWQEGLLPDEFWQRRRKWICGLLVMPLVQPIWAIEISQALVSPEFIKDIEAGLLEELVSVNIKKG
jgi:hypothetical protein